jgi:hypothetical protein
LIALHVTTIERLIVTAGTDPEMDGRYFNLGAFAPLRKLYPAVRMTNYEAFLWTQKDCIPSMNGFSYCKSGGGAVTGSLASRDFYNYFIDPNTPGDMRWHGGGPGLEHALRENFGVSSYPQTAWNAFRFVSATTKLNRKSGSLSRSFALCACAYV